MGVGLGRLVEVRKLRLIYFLRPKKRNIFHQGVKDRGAAVALYLTLTSTILLLRF